jgi:hypothetical protein
MLAMAWDSSRPVPYRRLLVEFGIYAAVMVVVLGVLFRGSSSLGGLLVGLGIALPLWIGFSYVLAKFGYQRRTFSQARAARTARESAARPTDPATAARPRPAPTKRTGAGTRPASRSR